MTPRPSTLRSVRLYALHDLYDLVRSPSLWLPLFLGPLLIGLMGGLAMVPMLFTASTVEPATASDVLVVVADEAWVPDLEAYLDGAWNTGGYAVATERPPDAQARLDDGRLDVLATLPPDFLTQPRPTLEVSAHAASWQQTSVRHRLASWWVHHQVLLRAGPEPEILLPVFEEDGDDVPDDDDLAATLAGLSELDPHSAGAPADDVPHVMLQSMAADGTTGLATVLGMFVLGLMCTVLPLNMGKALLDSLTNGFNAVLALGTAPRAIFLSETLVAMVFGAAQALGWLLLAGAGAVTLGFTGLLGDASLAMPDHPLTLAALLLVLCPLATLTSVALGLVVTLGVRDLPETAQERAPQVLLVAAMLAWGVLPAVWSETLTQGAAALPVVGPLMIWFAFLEGTTWVLWLLPLHVLWAGLAVAMGGWAVTLDDGLLTYLRRRRRPTA